MDARPRITWNDVRAYLFQRLWKLWSLFRRYCVWVLYVAVGIFLIDLVLPTIGNKYLPPRSLHQPKAPYGLSLVDPQSNTIFPPAVEYNQSSKKKEHPTETDHHKYRLRPWPWCLP